MFSSLSSCTPSSSVSTSFTSTKFQIFDIESSVSISVNGTPVTTRPITLYNRDVVTATVVTPSTFLGNRFYDYILDGIRHTFAVANRNNYNPTVKTADRTKRWYNYLIANPRISFWDTIDQQPHKIGTAKNNFDIDSCHVVLDSYNKRVNFYTTNQELISSVELPANPIEYKKIPAGVSIGTYTQELLVLCSDGILYKLKYDGSFSISNKFQPKVYTNVQIDTLPISEDIPGLGSFTDIARRKIVASLFPVVTSFDVIANTIWLVGFNTYYLLTRSTFLLLGTFTLTGEEIIDVAAISATVAIVTTKSQRAYRVNSGGGKVIIYSAAVLGKPATVGAGGSIILPDPHQKRLVVISSSGVSGVVNLKDFAPAYAFNFDGQNWVTGYDHYQVVKLSLSTLVPSYLDWKRKVTLISVQNNSILAIHTLENITTLNAIGIKRIVPFTIPDRAGPLSHISAYPEQVIIIGEQGVTPVGANSTIVWSNGVAGGTLNTGDYFGLSYKPSISAKVRTAAVIGETAIDFTSNAQSSYTVYDYFAPGTIGSNKYTTVQSFAFVPPSSVVGTYPIGFNLNLWGNIYSDLIFSDKGFVYFDSSFALGTNPPSIGTFSTDSIFALPGNLYLDYPIDNRDPLNITLGNIDSTLVPGLHYKYENLGDFDTFRIKWVGTTEDAYPLGNIIVTIPLGQSNTSNVNLTHISNVFIGDYVSSTIGAVPEILVSTTVANTFVYNYTGVDAYYSNPGIKQIKLTEPHPTILRYSETRYSSNAFIDYVDRLDSTTITGNTIIKSSSPYVFLQGLTPGIDTSYIFKVTNTTGNIEKFYAAASIVSNTESVTVLTDSVADSNIHVSFADYQKVLANHYIYGSSVTPALITDKFQRVKSFTLTTNYLQAQESVPVTFSVTASNVADGTQIPYTITANNPDTVLEIDEFFSVPNTGFITVNSGIASIVLTANLDNIREGSAADPAFGLPEDKFGIEFFTFTVSNLVPYDTATSLSVNWRVLDIPGPPSLPAAQANIKVYNEFYIVSSLPQTVYTGNIVNFDQTVIQFNQTFSNVFVGNIEYESHELYLFSGAPAISSVGPFTALTFTGNFITTNANVTVSNSTSLLFKGNVPAPTWTYQLGFYSGKNYQYIEWNYDTIGYIPAGPIMGAQAGDFGLTGDILTFGSGNNNSVVFGANAVNGFFQNLGIGSFDPAFNGYQPRTPRIKRVIADRDTEIKYEIQIDQNIPAIIDVRASLDYGYLYVNGGFYYGDRKIAKEDTITVVVPFNTSLKPVVVLLSIGDYQIGLPCVPQRVFNNYTQVTTLLDNQPQKVLRTHNIPITVTGEYMLPNYFKTAIDETGPNFTFTRIRPMTANLTLVGTYHNFQAGDTIEITNQFTSSRIYDTRDITLAGPEFLTSRIRTVGAPDIIDSFSFPVLYEPYARFYTESQHTVIPPFTPFTRELLTRPAYQTGNVTLTIPGFLTIPITLFVDAPGANLVIDGNIEYGDNYTDSIISTTGNLALQWTVPNYFAANATIWQIAVDSTDNSNIYIPVGSWDIVNRTLSGPALDGGQPLGAGVTSVTVSSAGTGYDVNSVGVAFSAPQLAGGVTAQGLVRIDSNGNIVAISVTVPGTGYTQPPTVTILGTYLVSASASANIGLANYPHTIWSGRIESQYEKTATYITTRSIRPLVLNNTFTHVLGKISSRFAPNDYTYILRKITSQFIAADFTVITGRITSQALVNNGSYPTNRIISQHLANDGSYPKSRIPSAILPNDGTFLKGRILSQADPNEYTYITSKITERYQPNDFNYVTGRIPSQADPNLYTHIFSRIQSRGSNAELTINYGRIYGRFGPSDFTYMIGKITEKALPSDFTYLYSENLQKYETGLGTINRSDLPIAYELPESQLRGNLPIEQQILSVTSTFGDLPEQQLSTQTETRALFPIMEDTEITIIGDYFPIESDSAISIVGNTPPIELDSAITVVSNLPIIDFAEYDKYYYGSLPIREEGQITIVTDENQSLADPPVTMAEVEAYIPDIDLAPPYYPSDLPIDTEPTQTIVTGRQTQEKDDAIPYYDYYLQETKENQPNFGTKYLQERKENQPTYGPKYLQERKEDQPNFLGNQLNEVYYILPYYQYDLNEHLLQDRLNLYPTAPDFFQPPDLYIDFDPLFFQPPDLYIDFDPLFFQPPDLYIDFDPLFFQPPDLYIDFNPLFFQPPDLYIDFNPLFFQPPDLYIDFNPLFFQPPDLYIDFDPLFFQPPDLYIDFDPLFFQPPDLYIDFNPLFFQPPDLYIDFNPLFFQPPDLYIDFNPLFFQPPDLYIDFDPLFFQPPDLYIDFPPLFFQAPDIYIDFPPLFFQPPDLYIDFDPLFFQTPDRFIKFDPLFFQPPDIYIDFPPLFFQPPDLYVKFLPEFFQPPDQFIAFQPDFYQLHLVPVDLPAELHQDILWEQTDWANQGAVMTEFYTWANEGRGGDLGQYQGTPPGTPGRTQGPFLLYQSRKGASVIKYSDIYGPGGHATLALAQAKAAKYVSATAIQILGTNWYNIRIFFDTRIYAVPKKGLVFPQVWLMRGG